MKTTHPLLLAASLLSTGCVIENDVGPPVRQAKPWSGDDESNPVPDGDTGSDGSDGSDGACSEEVAADEAVAAVAACEPEALDLTFQEKMRVSLGGLHGAAVRATRMHDTNADGIIDANDPMQLVVEAGWEDVSIYDHGGALLATPVSGADRAHAVTGDLDSSGDGAEALTAWYGRRGTEDHLTSSDASAATWTADLAEGTSTMVALADLEGDGDVEVLMGGVIYDHAGAVVAKLSGVVPDGGGQQTLAADLDRDGTMEVLMSSELLQSVEIFDASGAWLASCAATSPLHSYGFGGVAVGNLDVDDDAEIVTVGRSSARICDADGTVLHEVDVGAAQPLTVAIAELDGDPTHPEIVVGDDGFVLALDHELSVLWSYSIDHNWTPVSVADLDADGVHEVVAVAGEELVILLGDGTVAGSHSFGSAHSAAWSRQPLVVDVDADGLAEIVHAGASLVVLETTSGGWPTPGADEPWGQVGHYPGSRGLAGEVAGPSDWWLDDNVYNGLPVADGPLTDLGVAIEEVCVESCDDDAVVTLRLWNGTDAAFAESVTVVVSESTTGTELARTTFAGADAATAQFAVVSVPATSLREGLTARLEADGLLGTCASADDEATWSGGDCT